MSEKQDSQLEHVLTQDELEQLISECSAVETLVLAGDYGFKVSRLRISGDATKKRDQVESLAVLLSSRCGDLNKLNVIWVEY